MSLNLNQKFELIQFLIFTFRAIKPKRIYKKKITTKHVYHTHIYHVSYIYIRYIRYIMYINNWHVLLGPSITPIQKSQPTSAMFQRTKNTVHTAKIPTHLTPNSTLPPAQRIPNFVDDFNLVSSVERQMVV